MAKNGNGTWEPSSLRTSKHLKSRSWHHLYHCQPHPDAICCGCTMPLWMRFFDILGRGAVMLMEIQGMHVEHLGTFGVSRFLFENPLNPNHGLSPFHLFPIFRIFHYFPPIFNDIALPFDGCILGVNSCSSLHHFGSECRSGKHWGHLGGRPAGTVGCGAQNYGAHIKDTD
jgi:hypothetical protein